MVVKVSKRDPVRRSGAESQVSEERARGSSRLNVSEASRNTAAQVMQGQVPKQD
jgi:hypothetical protein